MTTLKNNQHFFSSSSSDWVFWKDLSKILMNFSYTDLLGYNFIAYLIILLLNLIMDKPNNEKNKLFKRCHFELWNIVMKYFHCFLKCNQTNCSNLFIIPLPMTSPANVSVMKIVVHCSSTFNLTTSLWALRSMWWVFFSDIMH